jgi:DNA-binding NarL/FixJ family response regulator
VPSVTLLSATREQELTRPRRSHAAVLFLTERNLLPDYLADFARLGKHRPVGRVTSIEAARAVVPEREPDIVVADVATVRQVNQLRALGEHGGKPYLVVVTSLPADIALLPALLAGARGYLVKPVDVATLQRAVGAVAAGQTFIDPRCMGLLVDLAVHGKQADIEQGLTLRQHHVVRLAAGGLSNREIAETLDIAVATVKSHLRQATRKMRAVDGVAVPVRKPGRRDLR